MIDPALLAFFRKWEVDAANNAWRLALEAEIESLPTRPHPKGAE